MNLLSAMRHRKYFFIKISTNQPQFAKKVCISEGLTRDLTAQSFVFFAFWERQNHKLPVAFVGTLPGIPNVTQTTDFLRSLNDFRLRRHFSSLRCWHLTRLASRWRLQGMIHGGEAIKSRKLNFPEVFAQDDGMIYRPLVRRRRGKREEDSTMGRA